MAALLSLLDLDQMVFYLINRDGANVVFDWILPIWRDKLFWLPIYVFIMSFMIYNFRIKGYWFVIFMMITVGAADFVSHSIVKKTIERLRPCQDPNMDEERLLVRCGSGYSFTSNHAANHFAVSMFLIFTLGRRFRKLIIPLFLWAATIAYAQVYVGVHYPLDVVCGAILGTLMAYLGTYVYSLSGHRSIDWEN